MNILITESQYKKVLKEYFEKDKLYHRESLIKRLLVKNKDGYFVAPNSHSVRSRLTSEVDSNAKEYGVAIWDNPRLLGESTKRWKIDNGEDHSSKLCMILGAQKFLPVTLTVIEH